MTKKQKYLQFLEIYTERLQNYIYLHEQADTEEREKEIEVYIEMTLNCLDITRQAIVDLF